MSSFLDLENINDKRENRDMKNRAFDIRMKYSKKLFGEKFTEYQGQKIYRLIYFFIRKKTYSKRLGILYIQAQKKISFMTIFIT